MSRPCCRCTHLDSDVGHCVCCSSCQHIRSRLALVVSKPEARETPSGIDRYLMRWECGLNGMRGPMGDGSIWAKEMC